VAVVFIAGTALLQVSRRPTNPLLPSSAEPVPVSTRIAAPAVGPDRDGGVAAALTYAAASQRWLYLSDAEVRTEVAEISTAQAAGRLGEQVLADVRQARKRLGSSPGPVWWIVRPLAVKVDRDGGGAMTVSVWLVTVLSAEQVAAPQAEWLTVTIDVEWADGWRVAGVRDRPGPTPASGPRDQPWNAVPFAGALSGFTRLDGAVAI
jgi:hypothetical protein